MTMKEALGIVLDLASQNALDPEDLDLKEQADYQHEALDKVTNLWAQCDG